MDPYRTHPTSSCPRCKLGLADRRVAGVVMLECGGCEGLFVPRAVLVSMIKDRDEQSIHALLEAFGHQAQAGLDVSRVVYLHCPVCDNIMTRSQFAKGAKVLVDICTCGVWFDAGEFVSVLHFVIDGGMERAAQRIATETAREEAAQSKNAPSVVRVVVSSRLSSKRATEVRTPLAPRNTAAIWSAFETLLKAPRK
jgi:Zn-finger nucleic acid-binding protein